MYLKCEKCGFTDEYTSFKHIRGCGWQSDLRECPRCGNECVFSQAEGLEVEHTEMKNLSIRLTSISKTDDQSLLDEAKQIIGKLKKMNLRWNIRGLDDFVGRRQRELFYYADRES